MSSAKIPARARADGSLFIVAAIWGLTFVMVKDAVTSAGPLTFLALRFSLAAGLLAPLLVLQPRLVTWGSAAAGAVVGCFLFAGYALQTAGLQYTTASKAGFITGLSAVIVPLLSTVLLKRPPRRATTLGVSVATVGLALLSLGGEQAIQLGDLLVLGCALCFALHILTTGIVVLRHDVLALTTAQIVVAALLNTGGALAFEAPTTDQLGAVFGAALFTGLFATVVAFYAQTHAQRHTTPVHTALIFSMEPVFAVLFGYLLAGERLAMKELSGCGLILVGMLVAQLAPETETTAQTAH